MATSNITPEHSTWDYLFTDLADQRTSGLFLMKNPLPVLAIVGSYLYFSVKCGPNFMKERKPFSLKTTMKFYNVFQVIYNTFLFYQATQIWSNYSWKCQPIDYSPQGVLVAKLCHLYFINKLTDLLDTVFFVLRKKNNHISFLHLFHHASMPLFSWVCTKYVPGGHATFIGLANSFVHILLYSYYFLAALGPSIQKYLWWKIYLTRIQLIQFCLIFLHNMQLTYYDCGFPRWTLFMSLPNSVFFYFLFKDFYDKSYSGEKNNKKLKK